MGAGAWILGVASIGWAAWLFAVARGMTPIARVRDERDALHARWLFGGLTAVGGLALLLSGGSLLSWIPGILLVASGAAVMVTARRLAPTDPTSTVSADDVQRAVRHFVFDSRPPARGSLEIHPKRGWSIFVAASLIGFSALLVVLGIDTFTSGAAAEFIPSLAFFVGMSVFFLVMLIAPSAWLTQRVIRGVPLVRIDGRGLVMGRDASRDAAITWEEVGSVEVRVISSNGITDRVLLIHPSRPDWNERQPWLWRIYGRLSRVMYGSHFAISTMALSVPIEELLARIAAHRPSAIWPESTPEPGRAARRVSRSRPGAG